jgi:hypothetical protein
MKAGRKQSPSGRTINTPARRAAASARVARSARRSSATRVKAPARAAPLAAERIAAAATVIVAFGWFASLVGTVALDALGVSTGARVALAFVVLLLALVLGALAARAAKRPLRRLFPTTPEASRSDFVGRECVIRTGSVTATFGQAEVTADDGSSAIVQVRQTGADTFTSNIRAYIYDYDAAGEFFWVVPADLSDRPKDR